MFTVNHYQFLYLNNMGLSLWYPKVSGSPEQSCIETI